MNAESKRLAYPMRPLSELGSNEPLPTIARICEVDFQARGGRLSFKYTRMANAQVPRDGLAPLFLKLQNEQYPSDFKKPRGTRRRSRMSLFLDENAYLIFVLKKGKHWQFPARDRYSLNGNAPSRRRFNLHVDLNEEDDPDAPGEVKYIPIIIDPDVGHPGGGEP